jgi:hypothetical protein
MKRNYLTRHVLEYISVKEFKKLREENADINVVGQTALSKWKEDKHAKKDGYQKLIEVDDNNNEKEYVVKPSVIGFKRKYAKVGENEYILVKNKILAILIFLFALGVLVGIGITSIPGNNNPIKDFIDDIIIGGSDIEDYPDVEYNQETISIPGLADKYTVNVKNRELYLVNPKVNDVYFKYQILLNGEVIYESNHIPPNKMEKVDLYEILEAGTHDIEIMVNTIDVETKEACNSAKLETTVTVIK